MTAVARGAVAVARWEVDERRQRSAERRRVAARWPRSAPAERRLRRRGPAGNHHRGAGGKHQADRGDHRGRPASRSTPHCTPLLEVVALGRSMPHRNPKSGLGCAAYPRSRAVRGDSPMTAGGGVLPRPARRRPGAERRRQRRRVLTGAVVAGLLAGEGWLYVLRGAQGGWTPARYVADSLPLLALAGADGQPLLRVAGQRGCSPARLTGCRLGAARRRAAPGGARGRAVPGPAAARRRRRQYALVAQSPFERRDHEPCSRRRAVGGSARCLRSAAHYPGEP